MAMASGKRARRGGDEIEIEVSKRRKIGGGYDHGQAPDGDGETGGLCETASASAPAVLPGPGTDASDGYASTPEVTTSRNDYFPFLDLPAELRLHVYRWALCSDEPLLLEARPPDPPPDAEPQSLEDGTLNDDADAFFDQVYPIPDDATTFTSGPIHVYLPPRPRRALRLPSPPPAPAPPPSPNRHLNVALLRTCTLIHQEAHRLLYTQNTFALSPTSSLRPLLALRQRSRSLITSAILTIPSPHAITDSFADLVRTGLRYCWGLRTLVLRLDFTLPATLAANDRHGHGAIYANAFRILRWLPKGCRVVLEGRVDGVVRRVVEEEGRWLVELDEAAWTRRQHQMGGDENWR